MPTARVVSLIVVISSLGLAVPASAELMAEPRLRLEGARYEPTEEQLEWTGWMGGAMALARTDRTAFDLTAEVETVMGDILRPFEALQANYHLELAVRHRFGRVEAGPFYHHVSRHLIDRAKEVSVDWNLLGLRLTRPLGDRGSILVSGGWMTRSSVGYRWELIGRAEGNLFGGPAGALYGLGEVRFVEAEPSRALPRLQRGDFADLRLELGPRWKRGPRSLLLFAAFERRNDVLLEEAGARNRAVLGFRILLEAEPPAASAVR